MPQLNSRNVTKGVEADRMPRQTRRALRRLKDEINGQTNVTGLVGNKKFPRGTKEGDITLRVFRQGEQLNIGMVDETGTRRELPITRALTSFIAPQQAGSAPPTTTEFPVDGNFGFFRDTVAGKQYWVLNDAGTIRNVSVSTLEGSITSAQHGDISAAVATHHAFTQITGTVTDEQHGARGRKIAAGTAHHTNATTTEPGFLSTAFFDLLNGATSAATASTLVKRAAGGGASFGGTLSVVTADASSAYQVAGVQVVSNQSAGWTSQTATPSKADLGAAPTTANIAKWCAAIQNALAGHGLLDA